MIKVMPFVNVQSWALPFGAIYKSYFDGSALAVQFLCVGLRFVWITEPTPPVDPMTELVRSKRRVAALRRLDMRLTKKYADQRQKTPRNRKRKPNKKIANVYSLA